MLSPDYLPLSRLGFFPGHFDPIETLRPGSIVYWDLTDHISHFHWMFELLVNLGT